jgi:hypothetical protein
MIRVRPRRTAGQLIDSHVQLLDAPVPGVGHEERAARLAVVARGDGQAHRLVEAALDHAAAAVLRQEVALGVEDLDALVAGVGDIDVAGRVEGDGARAPEAAGAADGLTAGGGEDAPLVDRKAPSLSKTWMRWFQVSAT